MHTHGKLRIEIFNDEVFVENGLLLWCDGQPDCWIVDPGLPPQEEGFVKAIEQHELTRRAILITHGHADHIAGIAPLRRRFPNIPVICPKEEVGMLTSAEANLSATFGLPIALPAPDQTVAPGETLYLGDLPWEVRDVSGHSPGGVAYYCPQVGVALVGDALFAEGIGRYDFPNSSRKRLIRNIKKNLLTLPEDTMIYPGHGPPATIGHILATNLTLLSELGR